ncbi:hypothetical protein WJ970_14940 [Achromobacter xylosoxidans]
MSNDEQFPRTAFSRRRFMQAMGVASGTLMAGGLMGARVNAAEDRSDSFDYVIVGAGSYRLRAGQQADRGSRREGVADRGRRPRQLREDLHAAAPDRAVEEPL